MTRGTRGVPWRQQETYSSAGAGMANQEHITMLMGGDWAGINNWRKRSPYNRLDLSGHDFSGKQPPLVKDVDLSGANLRGANLTGVELIDCNLRGADLSE